MAKKEKDTIIDRIVEAESKAATVNPLLAALAENDKRNEFHANVKTAFLKTGFPLFDYYFGSVINVHDEYGNIIKQEPRIGQAAGTFNLFIGNTGSGKAQPLSTKIPTPSGYKLMGNLNIGDKIFGSGGNIISVMGVYPQGVQDVYEITFADGRTAKSTHDHLWTVIEYNDATKTEGTMKVMSLKEIILNMNTDHIHYMVPTLSGPVQYDHQEVSMNPYALGALISSYIPEEEVATIHAIHPDTAIKLAEKLNMDVDVDYGDWSVYHFRSCNTGERVLTKELFSKIPGILEATEPEIPSEYLVNDVNTRFELLRGMMDVGGSITYSSYGNRYTVSFKCKSERIMHQMIELVCSMGFSAWRGYDDEGDGIVILNVPNEMKPMLVTSGYQVIMAESAKTLPDHDDHDTVEITSIRFSHSEECQCIKVSAPDELYVTENFIVTHNTTLVSQIAANIIRQYPYGHVIHYDCENRYDMSRCESITKLPASYFDGANGPERYMIKSERVSLEVIQEMIVRLYAEKVKLKDKLMVETPYKDEFQRPIKIYQPTVIIIDSLASVLKEVFNPESAKEVAEAEKMRSNTDGARDAKTLKGFLNDVIPLCKETNITIYGINHINQNMAMSAFQPVAKQQNYLKQDESIPGGKSLIYYAQNIVKLVAHPSDKFTEDVDGFNGYMVMLEPIKSSSNQSGNNTYGISFELVFSQRGGFDSLRSLILYGRDNGLIEGNKPKMKFRDDPSFTFSWKNLNNEIAEKPIWECVNKFIVPTLSNKLSFLDPIERQFDMRSLDY